MTWILRCSAFSSESVSAESAYLPVLTTLASPWALALWSLATPSRTPRAKLSPKSLKLKGGVAKPSDCGCWPSGATLVLFIDSGVHWNEPRSHSLWSMLESEAEVSARQCLESLMALAKPLPTVSALICGCGIGVQQDGEVVRSPPARQRG